MADRRERRRALAALGGAAALVALMSLGGCGASVAVRASGAAGFAVVGRELGGFSALVWDPVGDELVAASRAQDRLVRLLSRDAGDEPLLFLEPAQRPAALAFDRAGRLLVAETASRALARYDRRGGRQVIAWGFDGRRFGGPRAVAIGPDGEPWLVDARWPDDERAAELREAGVYRGVADGQVVRVLGDDQGEPRALAFAPDERTVFVSAVAGDRLRVLALDWAPAGTPVRPRRFAELGGSGSGALAVDARGHVFVATGDGVTVLDPSGDLAERLPAPEPVLALAFGGETGRRLFAAGATALYVLEVRWPGARR
ncbi:MAG: SMP-30/gluconolactonase/LRE family protein [Planctomycetes bacterium]|nr:SMP-30/gluconolactonase/LRE family protein [Planctomycetota bacterium]